MEQTKVTQPIDIATIKRVYSGKPGCGCGCRGQYWTDARNIKRVVNIMNSRLDEVRVMTSIMAEGGKIYSVEDNTRYYWAYTYID